MGRISEKAIIIRKPRKCFGCLRMLKKGDAAHVQTSAEDGRIYSLTLCQSCQLIVAGMNSDDEFSEGDLKEIKDE